MYSWEFEACFVGGATGTIPTSLQFGVSTYPKNDHVSRRTAYCQISAMWGSATLTELAESSEVKDRGKSGVGHCSHPSLCNQWEKAGSRMSYKGVKWLTFFIGEQGMVGLKSCPHR